MSSPLHVSAPCVAADVVRDAHEVSSAPNNEKSRYLSVFPQIFVS
jgi:hypothetical protein